jgi:hypothetical protein
VLGLVALGAVLLVETASKRRVPAHLMLIAGACVAATAISPLGTHLWTFIIESTRRSRTYELIEWLPPDLRAEMLPFWVMACLVPLLTLLRWRGLDASSWRLTAISLAMLPLALGAVRNVALFMLVAVPAASVLISAERTKAIVPLRATDSRPLNSAFLATAILVGTVIVSLSWMRPAQQLDWRPLSTEAIAAVRRCEGPLYNTYGDGGPLIWFVPDVPVFIDNRQDPYPSEILSSNLELERTGRYGEVFERYEIRCAILPIDSPTTQNIGADSRWSRIHGDDRHVVFALR